MTLGYYYEHKEEISDKRKLKYQENKEEFSRKARERYQRTKAKKT